MRHDPAVAIFEGPQHVIRWVNARFLLDLDFDPIGMPAREAFPLGDAAQDAMDRAFRSGATVLFHNLDSDLLIRPVWDAAASAVVGLATCWQLRVTRALPEVLHSASLPDHQTGSALLAS